jgi:hypothetical protein
MEESQTYSLLNGVKNIEPSDSRSGFTHHGNYKHLGATEYTLEERPIRNMPSNIKLDPDLWIDGRPDFINQIDTGLQPLPMKQKMKGNKLRKPKLKDNKLTREKELPINHPVSKSKAYRLNSGSNTSTPMNFNDRGRIVSNEIVGTRGIGKSSTNSFVFMKNSVSTIRKVSSYKVPDEEEKSEEKSEEIGTDFTKTSGTFKYF